MFKKLNRFLFIVLVINFSNIFSSLAEEHPKSIKHYKLRKELNEYEIQSAMYKYPLLQLKLLDQSRNPNIVYTLLFMQVVLDENVYFSPIIGDPDVKTYNDVYDPEFVKKALDYRLLLGCRMGYQSDALKALQKGASVDSIDYLENSAIFSLQNNGKICTLKEFMEQPLNNAKVVMVNNFFAGEDTCNLTPMEYAARYTDINTIERLIEYSGDSEQDKQAAKMEIERARSEISKFQDQIMQAQIEFDIPRFEIGTCSDLTKIDNEIIRMGTVYSVYDKSIHISILLGKNSIKIQPCEKNKYKEKYLDLDSLATVYSFLIVWNYKDGARISEVFKSWKDYKLFRKLVIEYVFNELRHGAYKFDPQIVAGNLIILARNIINSQDMIEENCKPEFRFLKNVFKYFFVLSHEQKDNLKECLEDYNNILKIFLKSPAGKELLKKLCKENKILYCPVLKLDIQKHVLREYVAGILSRGGSEIPLDCAREVAKYWEPDEKFIEAVRASKK